ncbi:neocarzinostatin apoprotein domain-containing protein [Streptacidiphilus pinicola]|uniref:neocarzinostatin apoprotein domain-containing protein n=1 Tax=Streptacidiphilus pinicola TaxID=2219663 RepID=UPI0014031946|nr:neocarzinostatin apoprotein domain-containing protein [Streptacidiphilus pinicola]
MRCCTRLLDLRPLRVLVAALLLALALPAALPAASAHAASGPVVVPLPASAKPGDTTAVSGSGWPASALLTVLLCGQNAVAGTDDCVNDAGRAVTTDASGRFTQALNVETPPQPCPCVIHVSTVLGAPESADAPFEVVGAPVKPIPPNAAGNGQLHALSASLTGDSGLLNWFGSPPSRTLRVIVTDLGATPVANPEFQMGTWHSVLAPEWSAAPWQGVIQPGQKVEIDLPVQFGSGASGRWSVALRYQGQDFASAYEDLPVAGGVYVFWTLLGLVVAVGLYRIGMAVLDKVRPDVVERHRERRRSRVGRHRFNLARTGEEAAAADGVPPAWSEVVSPDAPTQAFPLVPAPPAYAPTVRPTAPPPGSADTLPWFAPGTVTVTAPSQAAPLVRPPQEERPTDT